MPLAATTVQHFCWPPRVLESRAFEMRVGLRREARNHVLGRLATSYRSPTRSDACLFALLGAVLCCFRRDSFYVLFLSGSFCPKLSIAFPDRFSQINATLEKCAVFHDDAQRR